MKLQAQELTDFATSPEQRLVASVLQRAIRDLGERCEEEDRESAIEFFRDDSYELYSLNWVCQALNLDREYLLSSLEDALLYGVLPEGIENTKR